MSQYRDRIESLAARADSDRAAFCSPADPPDEERAFAFLRDGVGPAVWLYVEGRTGGRMVRFDPDEFEALEGAMNDWLELYAACYGVDVDADFTVRTAAELLLETRNVRDVAQLLTGVPERHRHLRERGEAGDTNDVRDVALGSQGSTAVSTDR